MSLTPSVDQPKTIYLKDYRPADFLMDTIHLYVDLHEQDTQVKSVLAVRRNPAAQDPAAALVLDGEALTLKKVVLNGEILSPSAYEVTNHHLRIANVPDQFTLETEVIIQPQNNTALSGLYQSRRNFCTQCEAHGFRRITYYLDRPDVLAQFTTTITADKNRYPTLLSNGNLIETKELSGNRHWVHWEDPFKKPCYLFALVAGDFDFLEDTFVTSSGNPVNLHLYLEKGFKDQGHYALTALKKAMRWDEETFGREYDLNIYMIVAVSDFNMGAMENKGLNVFNTKYVLAHPTTATDSDYYAIENVIGHEYFHNWSGNRVTCRDWFQITLKEGLTVLRDQLLMEDLASRGVSRIQVVNNLRTVQFAEDASAMAHAIRPRSYIEVNNFYTSTVYQKGAEVIRMVRTLLGKALFRQGMDLYFSRYDGMAVTTEDFIQAMQDASHQDLTQFRRWYDEIGTPILDVAGDYDEKKQTFTLTVKQSGAKSSLSTDQGPLHLPLAMGLIGPGCKDLPLQLAGESTPTDGTRVLEIKKPVETFVFVQVMEKPVPSLLRHFSAPVILNYPYTDDELLWLLQCDSDYFARWEAGQAFMQRLIFKLVNDFRQQRPMQVDDRLVSAFKRIITDMPADNYDFFAVLLALPSENYLMQRMEIADIEAIHAARKFLQQSLGKALVNQWQAGYEKNLLSQYVYNRIDMGKRSLKNRCLAYLTDTENTAYYQLAYQQLQQSNNMTDAIGALNALMNHDCDQREQALTAFYEKWQTQPLVVNKWLALQASSTLPSTLTRVKQLMQHPAFNMKNPNNVYSLIGAFGSNVVCFHQADGAGYEFIADQVLALDPLNPQVAARMCQPLSRLQKMDPSRKKLMQKALQRIAAAPHLSKDVYEIVSKSLEA